METAFSNKIVLKHNLYKKEDDCSDVHRFQRCTVTKGEFKNPVGKTGMRWK